jgi:hypothetical protein
LNGGKSNAMKVKRRQVTAAASRFSDGCDGVDGMECGGDDIDARWP